MPKVTPLALPQPFDRIERMFRDYDRNLMATPARLPIDAADLRQALAGVRGLVERLDELEKAKAAWTPHPIAEAPKNGSNVLVNDTEEGGWVTAHWLGCDEWSGWVFDDDVLSDCRPLGPRPTLFLVPPPDAIG